MRRYAACGNNHICQIAHSRQVKPMFEGNLVRLVVLEDKHLDHIIENWNNPEMRRHLEGVIPHSRQSEVDWLHSVQKQFYIDGEYVDSVMMEIFQLDTQD